jgi:hypothetical protein
VLALGTVLLAAGCGHAEANRTAPPKPVSSVSLQDGRGDLWDVYGERGSVTSNSDATGAVVRRTADAVVVTVRYAAIERRANPDWGVEFELDTGNGLHHTVAWGEYRFADTHRWAREVDYDLLSSEDEIGGNCPGLRGAPDFATDTVTVRVPVRCFKNAPWVVVKDLSATSTTHTSHYFDHLGSSGPDSEPTPRLVDPDSRRSAGVS